MKPRPRSVCALTAGAILSAAFIFAGTQDLIATAAEAPAHVPATAFAELDLPASVAVLRKCPPYTIAGFEDYPKLAWVIDGETVWTGDNQSMLRVEEVLRRFLPHAADDLSSVLAGVHFLCLSSIAARTGVRLFGVPGQYAVVIYTKASGVDELNAGLAEIHALQTSRLVDEGTWASSLEELGWEPTFPGLSIELTLEEGGRGWTATGTLPTYFQACTVRGSIDAVPSDDPIRPECEIRGTDQAR